MFDRLAEWACGDGSKIDWEAWTAIGTILLAATAVAVPAWLRWADGRTESRAQKARATIKAFRLYEDLGEYKSALNLVRPLGDPNRLDLSSALSFANNVQVQSRLSNDVLLRLEQSEEFGSGAVKLAAIITAMVRTSDAARDAEFKTKVHGGGSARNEALQQTQLALDALKASVDDAKKIVLAARNRRI